MFICVEILFLYDRFLKLSLREWRICVVINFNRCYRINFQNLCNSFWLIWSPTLVNYWSRTPRTCKESWVILGDQTVLLKGLTQIIIQNRISLVSVLHIYPMLVTRELHGNFLKSYLIIFISFSLVDHSF